jgi:4-amino-4-deoxy-L-arabinose transferase-like glycosyltransferase
MSDRTSANWVVMAGVTLLAATLRFPLLGRLPPGLYHDEAINGLDALRVLDGVTPVFFTANNGREPLFIYLIAGSIALLGRTALAIRVVSAILGTLTVPAAYLLGRRLFDRRVGLLTAVITAITVWPLNLSRVGFRAVAMPLFVALVVWAFWRGYERNSTPTTRDRSSWAWFSLAGVFAGLMLYTYLAARFVPLVFLVFIGYLAATRRPIPWRGLILLAIVAGIVAAPLLGYFVTHRVEAAQRAFQVSILNPDINDGDPLGTLARHLGRTLLMFNVRGDFIPRHNVPLRPVFDPLLSLFFLLGLGVMVRRWREPAYGLVLIWTGVMLLPTVLAEDAPHFLRAVGVLPVLFVIPALGLSTTGDWLKQRRSPARSEGERRRGKVIPPRLPISPSPPLLIVAGVLALSLGLTTYDYFVLHARSENAYYQFETGASELAADANQFLSANPNGQVYIDRTLWDGWAAIPFLVGESPRVRVLTDEAPTPPAAPPVLLAVWPFRDLSPYRDLLPQASTISVREGAKERGDLEPEARLMYVLFHAVAKADTRPPLALFGNNIALQEAGVEPLPDGRLQVRLVWECRQSMPTDYAVTVQLLGQAGLLTQNDGPPALGYYPTSAWRAGDRVVDERVLDLPSRYEPATQQLIVALYEPGTLKRLPVVATDGRPLGDHYTIPKSLDSIPSSCVTAPWAKLRAQ